MKRWTVILATLIVSLIFVIIGCDDRERVTWGDPPGWGIGSIQIILGTDTLWFLPGDSASTTVTIIVTDDNDRAVAGQQVDISLLDQDLGFIEYVDPDLRDTTNVLGRVECIYGTFGQSGDNVIRACVGGTCDEVGIAIRQSNNPVLNLQIDAEPHITFLDWDGEGDTVTVTVGIADENGNGIVGISLPLIYSNPAGRHAALPATDSLGNASTWWYLDEVGTHWVAIRAGGLYDTAWVDVYPPQLDPWTLNLWLQHDSMTIAQGEIDSNLVTAFLRDGFGSAVADEYIAFGLSDGWFGDISLTDSMGHSDVWWYTDHASETDSVMVTTRFEMFGLEDTVRFWVHEE